MVGLHVQPPYSHAEIWSCLNLQESCADTAVLIGFLTPALAAHSPNVHKGYDLYSAALPGVQRNRVVQDIWRQKIMSEFQMMDTKLRWLIFTAEC